jgi:hypothetical protein
MTADNNHYVGSSEDAEMAALDRLADAELRRRMAPPYRPRWELIGCRACGRRMYDDDGNRVHRWVGLVAMVTPTVRGQGDGMAHW